MERRVAEWLGALARIAAFVALFGLLGIALGALWGMLPERLQDPLAAQAVVVSIAALAAGALLIRVVDRRAVAALGLAFSRTAVQHVWIGVVIGAAGLVAAAAAMLATGVLEYGAQPGTPAGWITTVAVHAVMFTVAAFAEEVLFRGYAFQVLARTAGPVAAIVVSSVLFSIAHGANPSVGLFALVNIFLAGILLAIAYLRTLSLWFATAVHMGWNWAMASLFDLPVSGLQMFDTPLYEPVVEGPGWWSGGGFGPEGGLVGTLGFAIALLLTVRWRRVQPDPSIAAARPLVLRSEGELDAG